MNLENPHKKKKGQNKIRNDRSEKQKYILH